MLTGAWRANAFDPAEPFAQWNKVVSLEGSFAHFHHAELKGDINAWNIGARFSLIPLGITRFEVLHGGLDGALDLGLEPIFARFQPTSQNFGGLAFEARYHLVHFGRFVPWIAASIAPGGSDLRIGEVSNETRLAGSFMSMVRGEGGVSYFVTDFTAIYAGIQGEHFSNAGWNGTKRNFNLNTPWAGVFGVSWYFR